MKIPRRACTVQHIPVFIYCEFYSATWASALLIVTKHKRIFAIAWCVVLSRANLRARSHWPNIARCKFPLQILLQIGIVIFIVIVITVVVIVIILPIHSSRDGLPLAWEAASLALVDLVVFGAKGARGRGFLAFACCPHDLL